MSSKLTHLASKAAWLLKTASEIVEMRAACCTALSFSATLFDTLFNALLDILLRVRRTRVLSQL